MKKTEIPNIQKKFKCNIVGCEEYAEQINTPIFSSGMLCRKHFDEIDKGM